VLSGTITVGGALVPGSRPPLWPCDSRPPLGSHLCARPAG
jgi:hypothetical protein